MTAILNTANSEKFRRALDWTVFSIGALSLTFAIGATVASKINLIG